MYMLDAINWFAYHYWMIAHSRHHRSTAQQKRPMTFTIS